MPLVNLPNIPIKTVDEYSKEAREQRRAELIQKFRAQQTDKTLHTNRFDSGESVGKAAAAFSANLLGSYVGIPQISGVATSLLSIGSPTIPKYSTSPLKQLYNIPGVPYNDFRSRKSQVGPGTSADIRIDGTSTTLALRNLAAKEGATFSWKAALYAGASAAPGGIYNLFNRNSFGTFGYGWGDHGNPNAFRRDFTVRSHISSRWSFNENTWKPTLNPVFLAIPFRGDKVNVIDFRQTKLKHVYQWRQADSIFGGLKDLAKTLGETKDFIKFYFTGPKLAPHTIHGETSDTEDDVIVFRATIGQIQDSFQPQWNPITMVGRADPNYHYQSFQRDLSMDFTIYATDRDELKPIYRKLNALAGYTAPDYLSGATIGLTGPWMRITVGDLFNQVPVVISSLSYTFGDNESPWEINIEDDPQNMQVPFKIQVSISFSVITDWLPQKGGQFYSLSKRFDKYGSLRGSDNWLSDSIQMDFDELARGGSDFAAERAKIFEQFKNTKTVKGLTKEQQALVNKISGVISR